MQNGWIMRHRILVAPVVVFLTACSSSSPSTAPSPSSNDVTVSMELTVAPGAELHQCQYVALPTDSDINVVGITHQYTTGSHHFLVFMTDLDAIPPDQNGQYDCVRGDEPIMEHTRGILYGAQSPTGGGAFPDGIGFPMKAHQVLLLQAHYINATAQPLDAKLSATFATASADKVRERAGFMLFYDPFIYLPPQSTATSGIRCEVTGDIHLISGFTHYHQRGTGMQVWVDPDMTTESATPFYTTHDWEHPTDFQGPLAISKGSAVRLQCNYTNSDAVDVFQGPNAATSEMCVFAGLYYPALVDDFNFCHNLSITGTGTQTCSTLLSCVQTCAASEAPQFTHGGVLVGGCWEKCVAGGCAGATDRLLPVSSCAGGPCATQCSQSADACQACVLSACGPEVTACLSHTCSP
jgi:hypothetical protein